MSRLMRMLGAVAAGVLVCGVVASAWAYEKETLSVNGEQVTIVRDDYGVPHVFADSERGLFYGSGYAVAQDRLLQMEKFRRAARGTLAEVLGEDYVAQDKDARLKGYTELELQLQLGQLTPRYQGVLRAYADGVNAWAEQAQAQGKLPDMLRLAGATLAPWQPTDSIAIATMSSRRFGSGGGEQLRTLRWYKQLQERHGEAAKEMLNDVQWFNDPDAPTTIPPGEGKAGTIVAPPAPGAHVERLARLADDASLARAYEQAAWASLHEDLLRAAGVATKWGSYAVLVSPQRSASGSAVLLGAPQMGFETPQIAHEIHLCGAGFNSIGMGFAGTPGVLIGRNENIAWTTTSALASVEDIFAETLDPSDKHRCLHNGAYRDMERRVEVIKVRGKEPVELEVYRTVHGPVIEWDEQAGVAYSLAMNYWMREMDAMYAMVGFNQAHNIQEFAAWTPKVTTTHNWFCATQDGDIGFWLCGKIPRRSSAVDSRFPIPGTGEYDWQGDVPFTEMPQIINPRQGYLINWNTKPAVWWATGDASGWGAVNRLRSIGQALARHDLLTVAAMSDLQKDLCLNHWFADYFKQYLLDAAARKRAWADPRVREALRYLKAWDNHGADRSVGMTIFQAWHRALLKAVFSDEFGDLLAGTSNSSLDRSGSLLYRTLKGSKAGLPPSRDYWNGADRDQVMVDVLKAVLADLEKTYGTPQMNRWMYDLGKISFDPLPGIPRYNRGTYIQIVECSKPDLVGVSILPPGQSEDPKSPHYGDQRELAGYWLFKEQVFDRAKLLQ